MNANEIETQLAQSLGLAPDEPACEPAWRGSGLYADLTFAIIGAAIEVHRTIGPGKFESLYQHALERELTLRRIPFRAQARIAMRYKDVEIGDFVADFIAYDKIIIELKAVRAFEPVHFAQVLSYLSATNLRLGLLINFNVPVLKHGVRRVIR